MELFDETKNRSNILCYCCKMAKFETFFLNLLYFSREELFIILSTSLKFCYGKIY